MRIRASHLSLRYKLPLSYAAVALLTMAALGAILLLVLNNYYARAEKAYLEAGAGRAARGLSDIDWVAYASGATEADILFAERRTKAVAVATQMRIRVLSQDGAVLVDSGSPAGIDPSTLVSGGGQGPDGGPPQGLPSPLGGGLFGGDGSEDVSRSSRSIDQLLAIDGDVVATLRLSEAPAYGATVMRNTLVAWLVAGSAAVLLAAGLGWLGSRRITHPLSEITAASDSMAGGNLSARTEVDRADEIGRLANSFNIMAGRVQETVSTLQHFVADAAHEIGTPLTALEADLELAHDRSENDEERRRLVARAMGQAERIERLSAGLLQLSRLDTADPSIPPERVDLTAMLHHLADTVSSRAEQAGIDLALDLPQGEVWVSGYGERLRTAVGNLIDNALKFTLASGSVVVGLRNEGEEARLWVADTGIGIPAGDMQALFGRFHRGRNASAYPGSGLGLAIVKATAELHGGSVSAESSSAGSRFELTLPVSSG